MAQPQPTAILISPEARSAFFGDYIEIAREEFRLVFPDAPFTTIKIGNLDFVHTSLGEDEFDQVAKLSFFQGLFLRAGELLKPVELRPKFHLHRDFVFGSKFKGKTNERLTQMILNLAISHIKSDTIKVLDPMCGRGTTLLWAMRYGLTSRGIEQDPKAIQDFSRIAKKWNKIHQEGLVFSEGFVGKKSKSGVGRFIKANHKNSDLKIITGDSKIADQLLNQEKFDIIASDLPYGIAHHTTSNTRNPLQTLKECAPVWIKLLKPNGVIALAYNSYLPTREQMVELFTSHGLSLVPSATKHRMSESIVRDIVIFKDDRG